MRHGFYTGNDHTAEPLPNDVRPLRAVIYSRCSTEEESQKDALKKQVQESKNCVEKMGWRLVDAYVEAKSGTTARGRNEYERLCRDLESDRFDIIVIKSQDRLMRNTREWYLFLDRMQKNQKRLYMYLERKFYSPDDALITGIKAILAEEYSRELSRKINNAHQNRQREGSSFVFTNRMYGLRKLPDKSVAVEEGEAKMVRMLFLLSADGYGTHSSAELLYQSGYRNRNGKMLSASVIRNIIRNPIYMGTVIQNRQHYDFDSKRLLKNPREEWIVHENAVPAIVDKNLFERANRRMDERRQKCRSCKSGSGRLAEQQDSGRAAGFGGKYDFSGKLFCGLCGEPFYRTIRYNKEGAVAEWKCSNYLKNGRRCTKREQMRKARRAEDAGCDNVHLNEQRLRASLGQLTKGADAGEAGRRLERRTISILRKSFMGAASAPKEETEELREALIQKKTILLDKLLEGIISDGDYRKKDAQLQAELERAEKKLAQLQCVRRQEADPACRLENIRRMLQESGILLAHAAWMAQHIDRITVFPSELELFCAAGGMRHLAEGTGVETEKAKAGQERIFSVRIPLDCAASPRAVMEKQEAHILALMRGRPGITAQQMAADMGVNTALIYRRIKKLKTEGRVCYSSPNGRGNWIVTDGAK